MKLNPPVPGHPQRQSLSLALLTLGLALLCSGISCSPVETLPPTVASAPEQIHHGTAALHLSDSFLDLAVQRLFTMESDLPVLPVEFPLWTENMGPRGTIFMAPAQWKLKVETIQLRGKETTSLEDHHEHNSPHESDKRDAWMQQLPGRAAGTWARSEAAAEAEAEAKKKAGVRPPTEEHPEGVFAVSILLSPIHERLIITLNSPSGIPLELCPVSVTLDQTAHIGYLAPPYPPSPEEPILQSHPPLRVHADAIEVSPHPSCSVPHPLLRDHLLPMVRDALEEALLHHLDYLGHLLHQQLEQQFPLITQVPQSVPPLRSPLPHDSTPLYLISQPAPLHQLGNPERAWVSGFGSGLGLWFSTAMVPLQSKQRRCFMVSAIPDTEPEIPPIPSLLATPAGPSADAYPVALALSTSLVQQLVTSYFAAGLPCSPVTLPVSSSDKSAPLPILPLAPIGDRIPSLWVTFTAGDVAQIEVVNHPVYNPPGGIRVPPSIDHIPELHLTFKGVSLVLFGELELARVRLLEVTADLETIFRWNPLASSSNPTGKVELTDLRILNPEANGNFWDEAYQEQSKSFFLENELPQLFRYILLHHASQLFSMPESGLMDRFVSVNSLTLDADYLYLYFQEP